MSYITTTSLTNEIYFDKVFSAPHPYSFSHSIRIAKLNITSLPQFTRPLPRHHLSRPFPMTGVITFLCCSDTRRYVTAAGSICPAAPAPCSQWQMLFARDNASETKNEKLRQRNAIPRLRTCARHHLTPPLFCPFRRNYRPDATFIRTGQTLGITRKTPFPESQYPIRANYILDNRKT